MVDLVTGLHLNEKFTFLCCFAGITVLYMEGSNSSLKQLALKLTDLYELIPTWHCEGRKMDTGGLSEPFC